MCHANGSVVGPGEVLLIDEMWKKLAYLLFVHSSLRPYLPSDSLVAATVGGIRRVWSLRAWRLCLDEKSVPGSPELLEFLGFLGKISTTVIGVVSTQLNVPSPVPSTC